MNSKLLYLFLFVITSSFISRADGSRYIVVDPDGKGDFKTITAAIASLPMFNYERTVIFIKNGVYNEKIKIEQDYITLKGESREGTIMRYSQLRTDWIANKDSIGPGIINIHADDVIVEDMTVENSQPEIGPHAFTIYGTGTRTIILNCNILSKGGDTVSLWNYKTGMYYHANCYFTGSVDFVCPRGWCFIKDSQFFEYKKTASIWHAGGYDSNQKFVLRNCSFDGVKDFELGRHHYDAQFYLIDCSFSDRMADKQIYRVVNKDTKLNRPFNWGDRYYYANPHKAGAQFSWLKDNLEAVPGKIKKEKITTGWTFDEKWDPESLTGPEVIESVIDKQKLILHFNEPVTIIGIPEILTATNKKLTYNSGAGSNTINFICSEDIAKEDLTSLDNIVAGKITGVKASVLERNAILSIKN